MADSSVPTQCANLADACVVPSKNPLDRVFELGTTDRRRAISVALAAALIAHGGMAGAIHFRADPIEVGDDGAQELFLEREEPPPPPPVPEAPPPPEPPPTVVAKVIAPAPPPEEAAEEPPASEAAQAGEVLVQEEPEEEEQDTEEEDDNTIVVGTADSYAGGVTAASGTSALAVHGTVVESGGVPGGRGTAVAAPPPKPVVRDRSRAAWLEGSTSWDCDFPGEADRDHVNNASVEMTVVVSPNGKAQSITITDDPGHGFARMASACALKHKFAPALDPTGSPTWGTTPSFHVGFHR